MSAIPYSYWSDEDKERLEELWAQGLSIAEIMAKMGRSYAAVKAMRIKRGLPARLSPGNPTPARVLTPDEERQLRTAFEAMIPLADIGNALRLTPARVSAAAKGMGLARVMSRGGLAGRGGGTGKAAIIPRAAEDRIDAVLEPLVIEMAKAEITANRRGLSVTEKQIVVAGTGLIRADAQRGRSKESGAGERTPVEGRRPNVTEVARPSPERPGPRRR